MHDVILAPGFWRRKSLNGHRRALCVHQAPSGPRRCAWWDSSPYGLALPPTCMCPLLCPLVPCAGSGPSTSMEADLAEEIRDAKEEDPRSGGKYPASGEAS